MVIHVSIFCACSRSLQNLWDLHLSWWLTISNLKFALPSINEDLLTVSSWDHFLQYVQNIIFFVSSYFSQGYDSSQFERNLPPFLEVVVLEVRERFPCAIVWCGVARMEPSIVSCGRFGRRSNESSFECLASFTWVVHLCQQRRKDLLYNNVLNIFHLLFRQIISFQSTGFYWWHDYAIQGRKTEEKDRPKICESWLTVTSF